MKKQTGESGVKAEIVRLAKSFGYRVLRLNSGTIKSAFSGAWVQLCPDGTPDLLAVGMDGRMCWLETKAGGNALEHSQYVMITELIERGQAVIIAQSPLDFTRWHETGERLTLATLARYKVKPPKRTSQQVQFVA